MIKKQAYSKKGKFAHSVHTSTHSQNYLMNQFVSCHIIRCNFPLPNVLGCISKTAKKCVLTTTKPLLNTPAVGKTFRIALNRTLIWLHANAFA